MLCGPVRPLRCRRPGRGRKAVVRESQRARERPLRRREEREENGSLMGGPKDRIAEECCESLILKMFWAMSHEDVDVSGLYVLIAPDNRMVTHFQGTVGLVGFFVHTRQNMDVWPR